MGCKCTRPSEYAVSNQEVSREDIHETISANNLISSPLVVSENEGRETSTPLDSTDILERLLDYCDTKLYQSDIQYVISMPTSEQATLLKWAEGDPDKIVAYLAQKHEVILAEGNRGDAVHSPMTLARHVIADQESKATKNCPVRKRRRVPLAPAGDETSSTLFHNTDASLNHIISSPRRDVTHLPEEPMAGDNHFEGLAPKTGLSNGTKEMMKDEKANSTSSDESTIHCETANQPARGDHQMKVGSAVKEISCESPGMQPTMPGAVSSIPPLGTKNFTAPSPVSRRLAYFTSKYDIKSSISELSSPSHLSGVIPNCLVGMDELKSSAADDIIKESSKMSHYTMPPWDEINDPDIVNNFWIDGPPSNSDMNGWHHLGDEKWTDPDGRIALSNKQLAKIHDWRRISELTVPLISDDNTDTGTTNNTKSGVRQDGISKKNVVYVLNNDGQPMAPGSPLNPDVMRERPRARSIRQGFVGDCSFLSSLASLAEYEHRMKVPVLSSILYPQKMISKHNGQKQALPVINPHGMYACKLYFNGVPRKVLIDDFVPVRKDGKVLSAHTSNKRDMWVTILEKAFIKLMGGTYFMHGSNPGADLFHLTGWVPETVPFRRDIHTGSPDLYSPVVTGAEESRQLSRDPKWDAVWNQLYSGFKYGCCLACLGTSEVIDAAPSGLDFPEGVSVSSGIVARHAYSVIDMKEIDDLRLLYIRNPWACIRWKGAFGPGDKQWTSALERICEYDSKAATRGDNGSFWIQWRDVVTWFSHLYICWNSNALPFELAVHSRWGYNAFVHQSLLLDDSHCIIYNPQFHLKIEPIIIEGEEDLSTLNQLLHRGNVHSTTPSKLNSHPALTATVWILLSRHVRDRKKDLFQKYIACHIYEGSERQKCQSVPAQQGIYSNGECSLIRILVRRPIKWAKDLNPYELNYWRQFGKTGIAHQVAEHSKGSHFIDVIQQSCGSTNTGTLDGENFVVVVSQYSQKGTFNFTLRVHASAPCILQEIPPVVDEQNSTHLQYVGEWNEYNSGGCSNHLWSYFKNPVLRLHVPRRCSVLIILECPSELSVNLRLFHGHFASARALRTGRALSSGPYRTACCCLETEISEGDYSIIPSSFKPGETGAFRIVCHLDIPKAEMENLQVQQKQLMYILSHPEEHDYLYSLLPHGAIWNNHNQNVDFTVLPRLSLTPVPYPFLELEAAQDPFIVYQSKLKDSSFHALYAIYPSTPITHLAVQLKVLNRLAHWLLPSLRLFYKIDRQHPIFTRSHTKEQLLCLFSLEPVDGQRYSRDPQLLPEEGNSAAWRPETYGVVGSFRRSDIEGGLSENGKCPSTAADQFYHKKGVCTISPVTLYSMGPETGHFLLNVSTIARATVFGDTCRTLAKSNSTSNLIPDQNLVYEHSVGSFELNIMSDTNIKIVRIDGHADDPKILKTSASS